MQLCIHSKDKVNLTLLVKNKCWDSNLDLNYENMRKKFEIKITIINKNYELKLS